MIEFDGIVRNKYNNNKNNNYISERKNIYIYIHLCKYKTNHQMHY